MRQKTLAVGPTFNVRRLLVYVAIGAACASLAPGSVAIVRAQDPSPDNRDPMDPERAGLGHVLALQQMVYQAIARTEGSVVAIARVRKTPRDEPALDFGGPFRRRDQRATSPLSLDFVPNEYGAGVVLTADGLILTTAHVLGDVDENDYYVWINKKPYFVLKDRIRTDPWWDLAVIQVEAANLKPIAFSNGKGVRKGQFVIALGNPYAIARDGVPSVSWGMVSNIRRRAPKLREAAPADHETLHESGTLIQTDARVEAGYSGGALVNLSGEMVGLTTSQAGGLAHGGQAGLAIPVDKYFSRAVDDLKKGRIRSHGFLGVQIGTSIREGIGVPVADVDPTSAAFRSGLRAGHVVTHVDGDPVYDGAELVGLVSRRSADEHVVLTLRNRDGLFQQPRVKQLRVQLSKRPNLTSREAVVLPEKRKPWRGLRVDYLSAIRRGFPGRFDAAPARIGALSVEPDSPAWRAGMRDGQAIVTVNDKRVQTPEEFLELVAGLSGEVKIRGGDGKVRVVAAE